VTRIIAGTAGGRRLSVPAGRGTRPTSDRAREGLFATILAIRGPLNGARVLDLYAGSGAVGLEALSRGATEVLLVEADARAARVIGGNIRAVRLPGARLLGDRVERVLARGPGDQPPREVVFADPPYAAPASEVERMLAALRDRGWLAPGALVIVERATRSGPVTWPAGYRPERSRGYGEATFWYGLAAGAGPAAASSPEGGASVRRAVCPGSFDPVTNGHLDIVTRAAKLYDEVIVAVLRNPNKTPLFSADERLEMLREVTKELGNVRVTKFEGLIVDFCKANDISAIVKGLRAVSDFDYELQMAQMNYNQAGVETLFISTNPLYAFLSSSLVKDFAKYGGDVTSLVPEPVLDRLTVRSAESP
jgi:16S rRNA (guanine966-N2)-methyltransferase